MIRKIRIIAEAGVNHNASLDTALQLVDTAVEVGADYIKFQTAIPELVVTSNAPKANYQKKTTGANESQLEMTRKIHLPLEDFNIIANYCSEKGITFLSSAFDLVSVDYLYNLGQRLWKIPSGEITNLPYLRKVSCIADEIILSSGMSTLDEIEQALEVIEQSNVPRDRITVLHCNTEYPTPMMDVNLHAMLTIREKLGVSVGYSDHTQGIEVPIAAVALGAQVIEKHFTLSKDMLGPDHKASLEPDEFKSMICAIRNIEQALGNGEKCPSPSEEKNMAIARRSLVAAHDIKTGDIFTENNLIVKRPGTGISPMRWDEVLGREALRDFAPDELIEL